MGFQLSPKGEGKTFKTFVSKTKFTTEKLSKMIKNNNKA